MLIKDESIGIIEIEKYIQHITNLSQLRFHEPLINLVGYNIVARKHLLETATFRVLSRNDYRMGQVTNATPEAVVAELQNCRTEIMVIMVFKTLGKQ